MKATRRQLPAPVAGMDSASIPRAKEDGSAPTLAPSLANRQAYAAPPDLIPYLPQSLSLRFDSQTPLSLPELNHRYVLEVETTRFSCVEIEEKYFGGGKRHASPFYTDVDSGTSFVLIKAGGRNTILVRLCVPARKGKSGCEAPPAEWVQAVLREPTARESSILGLERHVGRAAGLVARYRHFPHYEDPAFIERYAAANREQLLEERDDILEEYEETHRDTWLIGLLKRDAPETYERMCWEVKALAAAERLAVDRVETRKPERMTEDRVRELLVNRVLRQLKDEVALREALAEEGVTDEDQVDQYVARFRRRQQERRDAREGNGSERLG